MSFATLDRAGRFVARMAALLGGAVLIALVVMTVISIIGRNLGFGPIRGDFEIVEAGVGFAVFLFMPWCQYVRAHATVEILAPRFGRRLNAVIDVVADALYLAAFGFLVQRLWAGLIDKFNFGETTFVLQFPIWWAYAACFAGGVLVLLLSVFCLSRSLRALVTGKAQAGPEAIH